MILVPGTRLGPYEIIGSLGSGGMGEVYRARDARLGRDVALKVLPAGMSTDAALERFNREARAVAALNHPHIVTIYSTEEADGVRFLTMEVVEGQPLTALISPRGMPLGRFLEIAIPLADAIGAAHQKRITHRDLKPSNVMITHEGRVKVLDFGLARIASLDIADAAATETKLLWTAEGTVAGTVPYMSPEMVAGGPIDHRSDLFSLGTMFHEMLTGERPFQGRSAPLLMSAILRDTPSSVASLRTDIPEPLARLVTRCLEKHPDDRVQTARDVHNELRHVQSRLPSGEGPTESDATPGAIDGVALSSPARPAPGSDSMRRSVSIAVGEFTARSGDEQSRTLGEGVGDDVIAGLAKFPYLSVVGRGGEAARYLLDGSARRSGATLRLVVHLTDTTTGAHIWSDSYTRDLSALDLFAAQDDLTDRIVSTVADPHGALMRSIVGGVRHQPIDQLGPQDLILRYWAYDHQHSPAEHARLRDAFDAAVERHPHEADLWAAASRLASQEYIFDFDPQPDSLGRARRAAARAVELEPAGQFGWESLAMAAFFARDREGFLAAADRAIALNPRNANALAWMASLVAHLGDVDRAREMIQRAMAINPQHPGWYFFPLWIYHASRNEWTDALQAGKKANMPAHVFDPIVTAQACVALGRMDEARAAYERFRALAPALAGNREAIGVLLEKWGWATGKWAAGVDLLWQASSQPSAQASGISAARGIVVLPFANLSADKENEYFGDGLAEEILNALAQIDGLKVIARTSAFSFKGKHDDVRHIAQALGVTHVLEGSVRRAGDRIRVTAQLIAAADGARLWSERYDRPMGDIFAMQDEIAHAITTALEGRLSGALAGPRRYRPRLLAYETFLRGRAHLIQFTPDAWNRAKGYFEQAIALDAGYADPHAELALGYFISGMHGIRPMRDVAPFVRAEVERALELNASDPRPRFLLGAIALAHDYDWQAAEAHFAASMSAPDVSPHARWIYASLYLRGFARFQESADEMERAVQQDPLNATWHAIWGAHLIDAERFDQAIDATRRATELEPNYFVAQHLLGEAYWASGRTHEAMAPFERAYQLAPWNAVAAGWLAAALWQHGDRAHAEDLIVKMGEAAMPLWGRVVYHLQTSDLDAAADWYHRMIEDRDPFALVYAKAAITERLRGHHRWPALAALMRLPAPTAPPTAPPR